MAMAAAAALAKAFRGGRRSVAASRSLLLLPGIGRRAPLEGGVGPLLPRLGAFSPASLSAPAGHRPLLREKVRFMSSDQGTDQLPLDFLKKYYIPMNGSFKRCDSEFVPLLLWKKSDELDFQLKQYKRFWVFPAAALAVVLWILLVYVIEYYRLRKIKQELADLNANIEKVEKEAE